MAIPERSIGRLLTLLPALYASQSLKNFPQHAIIWTRRLIDADSVGFNVVNLARQQLALELDPAISEFGSGDIESKAGAALDEHPLIAHFARTRESRALRLSDFVTRRQLHQRGFYQETLRPLRIEYLIAAPFLDPATNDHIALSLARESADFDDHDREMLDLLLPHFAQAYRNAQALSRARAPFARGPASGELSPRRAQTVPCDQSRRLEDCLGLSQREASVLLWIAQGKTSAETSLILSISRRTVDKHLERVYQKLKVESRVSAAALAWEALKTPQDFPPLRVQNEQ
jgi:DNA-binding CsgD family transcriptional regulator